MNLWGDFLTNKDNGMMKGVHYFPIYEKHFAAWQNKSMTFIEIGVDRGGSLPMWQRYFGPMAKIIGIDINPACKKHERPGIFIRIGDQGDPQFLQSVVDEFGVPDVLLDDGSHQADLTFKSFSFFYPKMLKNSIYMVEDAGTAYWKDYGGGLDNPKSFINISKKFVDSLNANATRGAVKRDFITDQTLSISFYKSVIVYEKGDVWWTDPFNIGKDIFAKCGSASQENYDYKMCASKYLLQ